MLEVQAVRCDNLLKNVRRQQMSQQPQWVAATGPSCCTFPGMLLLPGSRCSSLAPAAVTEAG